MNNFDPTREIAIIWTVEDVQGVRPDLDDKQAFKVLENIKRNHDAEVGVNWDVIDVVAGILYPKEKSWDKG
jgi:hypothetical protein